MDKKYLKKCNGCHTCAMVCPQQAITMHENKEGFLYPVIDKKKCISCDICRKSCPVYDTEKHPSNCLKSFAAYNKNEMERLNSSSGGLFILLAKIIIQKNGIVFGAYLDKKYNVRHGYARTEAELNKFKGSKYVQSVIGDSYKIAKKFLEEDKFVLFTGTPCQIAGLKKYLKKDYDKLYTQDIICHGVPSPLVWKKYKEYRKMIDKEIPLSISFRNKDNGWNLFNMKFEYKNKFYKQNQTQDLFMKAFLKNTILRNSCYNCAFKTEAKMSDITLGDFWGVENIHPELDDNKGISAIIINSNKGQQLFDKIKTELIYKETSYEDIKKYNSALFKSVTKDMNRKKFFKNLDKIPFNELVEKYTYKPSFFKKAINKLKYEISKIRNKEG